MGRFCSAVLTGLVLAACAGQANAATSFLCSFPYLVTPQDGMRRYRPTLVLRFHAVWTKKRAYAIGDDGEADEVSVVPNHDGVSFVSVTDAGEIMVTTISKDGRAVHSRHLVDGVALLPQQFHGRCRDTDSD
ncbi:MAG TPA: hypothetical protein PKA20_10630 [Burkholderiaceae bacterium]|nr:hypothetical protein [Burkholderiaceae bacterium]